MILDGIVMPGEQYTYRWSVPERSGPSTDDPQSIIWPYYSSVDTVFSLLCSQLIHSAASRLRIYIPDLLVLLSLQEMALEMPLADPLM